ncbi:ABC transporter substrate-binding protein [Agromyces sp. ISL-38]|uniref:ABC transporter substrate-binding protein n=1 Tax=Agromyces sp. ISL-38 TaxID=2819107 RepID=UPI001BE80011|nr:ABC transporter substrate-binding protein [Agromyces sp. ISL-38]MBT2499701.1 ABC transporter substrate-binding protein [Agromyces sp. ISL-38]
MKLPKKAVAVASALAMVGLLTSCIGGAPEGERAAISEFPDKWDEEITIDVFDEVANYMGVQEGWFADLVKKKFNMKLNIIAPNVAGGGDTLYNTRVSAGNLGDLIFVGKGKKLDELIQGGLVLDSAPFYPAMENVEKFDTAVTHLNDGKDGVFAFPTQVSSIKPTEPSEGIDPTFGPYVRWDLYKQLGYPELNTLEDLLPVLKGMQDLEPTAPNGAKVYALSLFKDWDGSGIVTAKQPPAFYGYEEMGFAVAKPDGSDYHALLDDDSEYLRTLKFYHEANKLGLIDPESTTQNYDTMFSKFQNGQVLFSWWPWLGQAAYNTDSNTQAGKGFQIAPLEDMDVLAFGAEVYGAGQTASIGSKAKDPERVAAFIDWLYSPEGTYANNSQTMGAAGPKGLTWDLDDSGQPVLTELGKQAFIGGEAEVPAEWGGGSYIDGGSALNVSMVLPADIDEATGLPFSYKSWPSYQELVKTPLSEDWKAKMGDAPTTMDYLKDNDQLLVATGASYTTPTDSSEIQTLRKQVEPVIVQYSWKMVFAGSDAEFDQLKADMQAEAKGLGYDKVLEVDLERAKKRNEERDKVAKEFG